MDTPDEFAPTPWELAADDPDHHLIGWDPGGQWCGLFVLAHNTARLVEEREGYLDSLRALPLRAAVCYRHGRFLWAIDEQGCSIWSHPFSIELDDVGDALKLPGRKVAKAEVASVQSFSDDEDARRHGVELALKDGSVHEILMSVVEGDDGTWAKDVAQRLAERLSVPVRHVVPGGYKPAFLRRQAESARQTSAFINGLVDAFDHYDDPDRVEAREAREAARERRDAQILRCSYIETGQRRIVAWDRDDPTLLTIVVADRIDDTLLMRVVERRRVEDADRESVNAQLRDGSEIGATYRRSLVYWVIDDTLCAVFRRRGQLCALSRVGGELQVGERLIPMMDVSAVVAFAVPERRGHRGLALALASGEYVLVEEDEDARHDDKLALTVRGGWSEALAPELAQALGVEARCTQADVIVRPPPPLPPSERVLAACGPPVLARTLSGAERERARREGRVVHVHDWGWRSMGDAESHAAFGIVAAETGEVSDDDLVFATPVPPNIDGTWSTWETTADVYQSFGIEPPA